MIRYDRPSQLLAVCLAALAGFVDALGFIHLGGYFASFMSGNSTRMAVGLVRDHDATGVAGGLIGLFVLGVMLGALVGHLGGRRRPTVVLVVVGLLLFAAAFFAEAGDLRFAVAAMVLAMGAENAVFQQDGGDVTIGLTYMTGTLVKFGQRLMAVFLGGDLWAWVPYLLLWLGLIGGAVAGALVYPVLQLQGLWIASAAAAILAGVFALASPNAAPREKSGATAGN